jgi:membrane fusion protein (multidrug efflux system)
MNWKVIVLSVGILGGLALAAGGVWGWKTYGAQWWKNRNMPPGAMPAGAFEPAEAVQVISVGTGKWRPTANMVGTVFPLRSVTVSNEVAGTVKEVNFDSGTVIEAGAPLLTLDTSTEEADLKAAEAAINVAKANIDMIASTFKLAESNWRRVSEAAAKNAIAAIEADKAKAELDSAQANVERMTAELNQSKAKAEQVQALIRKKHIMAPFKGRTGIRTVHPGQYLKEGTEIVVFQGIDPRIYLDFALPQEESWRVKPGAIFMVSSAMLGDKPVPVEVAALDAQVNMATRNVRVRSIIANPGEALRPGMSVDVSVPIGDEKDYVVVPNVAVRRATYGDHVFVIGPSTNPNDAPGSLRASQRFIKLGPTLGPNVIVADDRLKVGEKIASIGSFKLHDGGLVNANPEAAPGAPPAAQPQAPTDEAKKSNNP